MTRLSYGRFRLLESCADQGGYLVQRKRDGALVATLVKHPDDPPASLWEARPYDAPPGYRGGRFGLLREAALAAYDEWSDNTADQIP